MPRIPYLLNYDDHGLVTAVTIDGVRCAATDLKTASAVKQFRKKLTSYYEEHQWLPGEELAEATVHYRRVAVRPTIHDVRRDRRFPSSEMVRLPVRSVQGTTSSKQQVCYLPDLQEAFSVLREDKLSTLIEEAVRTAARKMSPRQLARSIPPDTSELRWITVKPPKEKKLEISDVSELEQVAYRLDSKSGKRLWRPAWGREEEVRNLASFIESGKSSLLLVGQAGAGKTTVLAAAAREILRHRRDARKGLVDDTSVAAMVNFFSSSLDRSQDSQQLAQRNTGGNRVYPEMWLTSAGRLIAGMQYLGQWEERCESVIDSLARRGGVLCLESLQELVKVGGQDALESIGSFLVPYIAHGQLRLVAETTPEGLDVCRRMLPGLADLLEVQKIDSMPHAKSCEVLGRVLKQIQRDEKLSVQDGLADRLDRLQRRLQPYEPMPGPAVGIINSMVNDSKEVGCDLDDDLMIQTIREKTGLPEWLLRDEVTLEKGEVESHFQTRVIAQQTACKEASSIVLRWKAGLNNPNRPLGVFLLCGPSGVGKTHLAKTLAEYLFSGGKVESPLVRLDMSEYSGFGAAERFLADSGDRPAPWIQQIRRQPFAVLLLDEIEKASSDVFDCLLTAIDEGRLVDTTGRVTHLEGCVILMTSNLGSDRKSAGFAKASTQAFKKAVTDFFRPEFFNRLDSVVGFDSLDDEAVARIACQQLKLASQREGLQSRGIRCEWTDELVWYLARTGIDPRYGARPMQRHVEQEVIAPLARRLSEGLRPERVRFDVVDGVVSFEIH